jgi:malonyl-CoA O-methyltransferase
MDTQHSSQEARVPGLDPVAAARWRQLPRVSSPWLHEEIGARMSERLDWIKQTPGAWLHWAPMLGGLQTHRLVAERYPLAKVWLAGERAREAADTLRPANGGALAWLKRSVERLNAPAVKVLADNAAPPEPVDMLWANMALHQTPYPKALLAHWRDALQVGGFLMLSCLGPDTLREVRSLFATQGWAPPTHQYTDMHDWGDMLVEVGFAEPVMDMERITLVYPDARRLLQDLRETGRNLNDQRFGGLRGRAHRLAMLQVLEHGLPRNAEGQLTVTVEVVYGHAFKAAPRVKVAPASTVSVQDMKAMLRQTSGPR